MKRVTLLTLAACLAAAHALLAQEAPSTARVFERLEGAWSGSGTLFGRPAGFEMEWRLEWDGRIATLRFNNAFVAEDGARTPVLEATAYYRAGSGGEERGTWIDSRGEILALRFEAGDSTLMVHWEADSESGRTEYRLAGDDVLEVLDLVRGGDDWREFGRASYRRATPSR